MHRFDIVRTELPIAELQMVGAKWKIEIKKRVLVVSLSYLPYYQYQYHPSIHSRAKKGVDLKAPS